MSSHDCRFKRSERPASGTDLSPIHVVSLYGLPWVPAKPFLLNQQTTNHFQVNLAAKRKNAKSIPSPADKVRSLDSPGQSHIAE
jgi:hypothetical protein